VALFEHKKARKDWFIRLSLNLKGLDVISIEKLATLKTPLRATIEVKA